MKRAFSKLKLEHVVIGKGQFHLEQTKSKGTEVMEVFFIFFVYFHLFYHLAFTGSHGIFLSWLIVNSAGAGTSARV